MFSGSTNTAVKDLVHPCWSWITFGASPGLPESRHERLQVLETELFEQLCAVEGLAKAPSSSVRDLT